MSTSGLAQFTHSGNVTAGTVVELPVRLDQVDDVLKSLTVFDGAGTIGAVSLPVKHRSRSCSAIFPSASRRLSRNRRC